MPLHSLNTEQKGAACAPQGHNLIIASAGTGKTSTIVGRIAYLLSSGILPEQILLLTFTNKAASEMIARVAKYFGKEKANAIESGTFHSICYKWLKKWHYKVTLKQPKELKVLFKTLHDRRVFPTHEEYPSPYAAAYLLDIYSLYVNSSNEPFKEWLAKRNGEHEPYFDIYEDLLEEFKELKKTYGYADYNDLLLFAIEHLKSNRPNLTEVLVDEYQDTNFLQHSFIEALQPDSLFCVGDYDQSIYAFNGADIGIIASFSERHRGANIHTLVKNYRSTAPILELANRVISKNERIYPKRLEVVNDKLCEPPKLLVYEELFEQYQGIAARIRTLNIGYENIAVLFRNNSSGDGIEASLREVGIPSKRKGSRSFFDSKEVSAMLDICALAENPKDMMSFVHVLSYGRGIGDTISKDVFEGLSRMGEGSCIDGLLHPKEGIEPFVKKNKNVQLGLFDDFFEIGSIGRFKSLHFDDRFLGNPILKHPKLCVDGAGYLWDMYNLFKELRKLKKPSSLIEKIYASKLFGNIVEHLASRRAIMKDGSINEKLKREAKEKIERRIKLLHNLSSHYDELNRFLNAMVLGSNEMSEGEGVNLMSVHASKGLEFNAVFVVDLMDNRFPNSRLMSMGGSIEEERRLFYVALTRAKERLFLSYAKRDAIRNISYSPSIFLAEAEMIK